MHAASGALYFGSDLNPAADLEQSAPYGRHHHVAYTVALISDIYTLNKNVIYIYCKLWLLSAHRC